MAATTSQTSTKNELIGYGMESTITYENDLPLSAENITKKNYKVGDIEDIWKGQPTQDYAQLRYFTAREINHCDLADRFLMLNKSLYWDFIAFSIEQ